MQHQGELTCCREQLATYPNVEVRDVRVESVSGTRGAFLIRLDSGDVQARRVLSCTGMIDEALPIEGFSDLWGHAIFPGVFAAGDLTTRGQAAIFASSASVLAATMINFELNSELALSGAP